ncbi:hypothetical protein BaRGS_00000047 [Batillaria attramentaria]|uniref:Uncharacterized protein n=1 Tax=Batillaria attramentaria TaxID=370345 RepID=A0ABD0MAU9_9CAEN
MALTAQNMVMLRKVHCVIGGFCISFAAGQFLLLGNFGTYVESYMTERVNFRPKSKWFISAVIGCNLAAASVMMFVGGFLERRLGTSWATGARVLSYWVVQQSVAGTIILFGIFPGFGFGLLYGLPFSAMHKHTFHNLGLMYGLASSGYGVGAFVFNLLITGFTNPWNEKPDAVSKSGRHFSQPHILDRVPVTFLILAGIYTAFLPIAVTGVRDPPHSDELKILIKDPVKRRESRLVGNPGLPPRDLFKSKTFYVAWLSAFLIGMVYFLATGMYKARIPAA